MNQKALAFTVALTAGVAAFFASSSLFGGGGTKLRPTSAPKLDRSWSPWRSFKDKVSIGFPPGYADYFGAVMSKFMDRVGEFNPPLRKKLEEDLTVPGHVVTVFALDQSQVRSFVDHFTIVAKKGWPKQSVEDFVGAIKKDASTTFPNARDLTAEAVEHPNGTVAKVEYDTSWKGKKEVPLHVLSYVFIDGPDSHMLTFTTLKDRAGKTMPIFEKCFQTFRVTR